MFVARISSARMCHRVRTPQTGNAMCGARQRHGRGQHRCFADTRRWLCADEGVDSSDAGECATMIIIAVILAVDNDYDDYDFMVLMMV